MHLAWRLRSAYKALTANYVTADEMRQMSEWFRKMFDDMPLPAKSNTEG